jgi:hypothetical protein
MGTYFNKVLVDADSPAISVIVPEKPFVAERLENNLDL